MENIVYVAELGVDTDNPLYGRVFMVEGGQFLDSDDAEGWARDQIGKTARAVLDAPARKEPEYVTQMDDSEHLDRVIGGYSIVTYDTVEGESLVVVAEG